MACSKTEAELRVNDLFETFSLPPNKAYAKQLRDIVIKYDDEVYLKALKVIMLEIYPKSLPNLGMIKKHLQSASKDTQRKAAMNNLLSYSESDKTEWQKFIQTILLSWSKLSGGNLDTDQYHKNMAKYFDSRNMREARDMHLEQISSLQPRSQE